MLNINELAGAVKPVVLPGEELHVTIVRDGKEAHQGVGYLDDGTMIVVENGRRLIGEDTDVQVTSVLQTVAGRMIFAKVEAPEPGDCRDVRRDRGGRGPRRALRASEATRRRRRASARRVVARNLRRDARTRRPRDRDGAGTSETMAALAACVRAALAARVVRGGATRQDSVATRIRRASRAATPHSSTTARGRSSRAGDVRAGMAAVAPVVGALLAAPVIDTIKVVRMPLRTRLATLARATVGGANAAVRDALRTCAARTPKRAAQLEATDDAMLLERAGSRRGRAASVREFQSHASGGPSLAAGDLARRAADVARG